MKKVLLITPPYHSGVVEAAGRWPPLGFLYVAGSLREAGYQVEIYDAMSRFDNLDKIRERLSWTSADVVATTAYTSSLYAALDVLKAAKEVKPNVLTVIGGVHPHFCYEEVLEETPGLVDFVIRGEGEITFPALLQALERKENITDVAGIAFRKDKQVVATPLRSFIENLDVLSPAWDLLDWREYTFFPFPHSKLAAISTSRGCEQKCSFCSQQKFWHRSWRARKPEKVVDEIIYLHRTYGIDVFLICDELPTGDPQRWEAILDGLIQAHLDIHLLMETRVDDIVRDAAILEKYRRARVLHIYVGVEATSQETLERFKKDARVEQSKQAIDLIREHGMISETSLVLGVPEETKETVQHTLRLAMHYNPDTAYFLALAPWPYADIYEELKPYIEDYDYSKYNLVEPVIKPKAMTRRELTEEILRCYRTFYMNKLQQWAVEKDEFRREYFFKVMRLLINNSYLKKHMTGLGEMPEAVRRYLSSFKKDR